MKGTAEYPYVGEINKKKTLMACSVYIFSIMYLFVCWLVRTEDHIWYTESHDQKREMGDVYIKYYCII